MDTEKILNHIKENDDSDEVKELRKNILEKIGAKLYKTWFYDAKIFTRGNYFVLFVKNEFFKDMIVARFNNILKNFKLIVKVI